MLRRGGTQFFKQLQHLTGRLVEELFPPACPFCLTTLPARHRHPICPQCMQHLLPLPEGRCTCCALPFRSPESSPHLCSDCLTRLPPWQQVYAYGAYQGDLKRAVLDFKFNGRVVYDRALTTLLDRAVPADLAIDLVIAVPLHVQTLKCRGYNQAQLIADELCRQRSWPGAKGLLIKDRMTVAQHELNATDRRANLRNAFRLSRPVKANHILLVDDVMTTGATASTCAKLLLSSGVQQVSVAVIARAGR